MNEIKNIKEYIGEKIQELSVEIHNLNTDKVIDCVILFPDSEMQYEMFNKSLNKLGEKVDAMSTGNLYRLHDGIDTRYGTLNYIKVRTYEYDHSKYGISVDFTVEDYMKYKAGLNSPVIKTYSNFELIQFKTDHSIINVVSVAAKDEYGR